MAILSESEISKATNADIIASVRLDERPALEAYSELDVMARTIRAESRGEPIDGQIAVGWVIRNRAEARDSQGRKLWWGGTIREVVLKPYQFSCWLESDPNFGPGQTVGLVDKHYKRALGVAAMVLTGSVPDPTGGALWYHADSIEPPQWTRGLVETAKIGAHRFYCPARVK